MSPPSNWKLNSGHVAKSDFPCEARRVCWVRVAGHANAHHAGTPIHANPSVFFPANLDLAPFDDHKMTTSIWANVTMLLPTNDQCDCTLVITREEIKACRHLLQEPGGG